MPGYQDTATGKWYKASKTSQATAKGACIFMSPGAGDGSYVLIARGKRMLIDTGATTMIVGKTYAVSASGAIREVTELSSGDWKCHIGEAISASVLRVAFNILDVQVP
jgi:hypothetical protein